jgi:hypothetical protein
VEVVDGPRMTLDENEQKGFVSLDGEFDSDIDALNLEMIFEELIVKDVTPSIRKATKSLWLEGT